MHSITIKTTPLIPKFNPKFNHLNSTNQNPSRKTQFNSLKCFTKANHNRPPRTSKPSSQIEQISKPLNQISKIQILSSEFRALPEPIDRVKRLLHYAALLEPLHKPGHIESNRVMGCTTQVWLEAGIDSDGLMRFRADSDSEITKGFCYCLVWALNGAAPKEVLAVVAEDLVEMNVGFSGRSKHSRVNTWQNVLVGMQRRTEALAEERKRLEGFPSFVV